MKYYTSKEICERYDISRDTLRRWMKNKEIPYYRFGKKLYFDKKEIKNWERAHKK